MTATSAPGDGTDLALGPAESDAAAVAILLHGRGRTAQEMRALAKRMANHAIRFVLPEAPDHNWYPNGFMHALADNEPALSRSLARCEAIVDGLIARGRSPGQILLGGFSQGACLAAEFAIRHPRPYGALLIFTGGLIGPPGTEWPEAAALDGVPVYLTGSTIDTWVPAARVEETARVMERNGVRVTLKIFDDRDHAVSDEEIAAARDILAWWGTDDTARREERRVRH